MTPRWRRNGKKLYYIAPDGTLMAVSFDGTGAQPKMGTPTALFPTHAVFGGAWIVGITWQYDVAEDGGFLVNVLMDERATAPITVIQNWAPRK